MIPDPFIFIIGAIFTAVTVIGGILIGRSERRDLADRFVEPERPSRNG